MLDETLFKLIVNNKFFDGVDKRVIHYLHESFFVKRDYPPEKLIIRQGDFANEMFLIASGNVRITKTLSNGEDVEIVHREEGDFIGELSLLERVTNPSSPDATPTTEIKKRSANVYSITPVTLISIKKEHFYNIIELLPQIKYNIATTIASRLRESDNKTTWEIERNIELLELNQKINAQKKELEKLNRLLEIKNENIEKEKKRTEQLNQELQIKNLKLSESKAQLKEANASKDKFFSIIAHDLKNPLGVMIGFSDMLVEFHDDLEKEDAQDIIEGINESSRRLLKLLENLLDWSMSQTGSIKFEPESLDIAFIVMLNIVLFNENAHAKNISLKSEIPEDIIVYADKDMINTVIRNLTSNALKFTPAGGNITFLSEEKGDFFVVSVIDNGVGIENDDLDKLFRIDVNHTTEGTEHERGTGLGLILCKEFIEKNQGKIWVESKLGQGSAFRFTLPKAAKIQQPKG